MNISFFNMNLKKSFTIFFLIIPLLASSQNTADLNKTDQQGRKQGQWIKYYPDKTHVLYDGTFLDDQPAGEFNRYYEDGTPKSKLVYSQGGKNADATIYHPNGYIASSGKYINQLKEGEWKFFSYRLNGLLINIEFYSKNMRNGLSLKFYPDSSVAERVNYISDKREGEWLQFHPDGKLSLKAWYKGGLLEGKFEVWYPNGKPEFFGYYKSNLRDGTWRIYKPDGSLKYELHYAEGKTSDPQMESDTENLFNDLEKNKGKIADPEKTGEIR
jgi:antitoxin component YwqK of YwqJK toxin-antitoxin module